MKKYKVVSSAGETMTAGSKRFCGGIALLLNTAAKMDDIKVSYIVEQCSYLKGQKEKV